MTKDSASITFRLSTEEKEQLKQYCEENDMSISQVIRRAVKEFLNKQ